MAGTTVRDNKEVETCFAEAAQRTGLVVSAERITAVQGWAKRFVFETLWQEQLHARNAGPSPSNGSELEAKVDHSYAVFRSILENHYQTSEVVPTPGCLDLFAFLKASRVKIALTTGFYRQVTDIILNKLGWNRGLDARYVGGPASLINVSVASDEVAQGRPAPLMIQQAMLTLGITDPRRVINLGDTPSDLESGKRAGCALSLGITNGTHTRQQLERHPNDGLYASLTDVQRFLERAEGVGNGQ